MSKQYNLKDINGLYLRNTPQTILDENNFSEELITDEEFFPDNKSKVSLFSFKNSSYKNPGQIIGSNAQRRSNSDLKRSEIVTDDRLVYGFNYYNKFKLNFRFYGSTISNYKLPGLNTSQTLRILNKLRVKIYVSLGTNLIPMRLSDLEKYVGGEWVPVTELDLSGGVSIENDDAVGIQLTTGVNDEPCIDLRYPTTGALKTLFESYNDNPNGYNFRMTCDFDNFEYKAKGTKKYCIVIKYFNIKVSGTGVLYSTSENVELMSTSYSYIQDIETTTDQPEFLIPDP
jgi:hypothetical protein